VRVSQAYLILYAYHLMSKVNIVNKYEYVKDETGVSTSIDLVNEERKKKSFLFFVLCVDACFMFYTPKDIFFNLILAS